MKQSSLVTARGAPCSLTQYAVAVTGVGTAEAWPVSLDIINYVSERHRLLNHSSDAAQLSLPEASLQAMIVFITNCRSISPDVDRVAADAAYTGAL